MWIEVDANKYLLVSGSATLLAVSSEGDLKGSFNVTCHNWELLRSSEKGIISLVLFCSLCKCFDREILCD